MKLRMAAALGACGYYCGINVTLSATTEAGLANVTDVDVLGIRHEVTFEPRAIAISCKSGQQVALAKEVFYLRGVLDYVHADEGAAIFLLSSIPLQLRDLGRQLNVLVMSEAEGEAWRRSITNGLPDPGYYHTALYDRLKALLSVHDQNELSQWLRFEFWFYRDFRNLSRGISRLRAAGPMITLASDSARVLVFHVAAHLALTIIDLCRNVRMMGVSAVEETAAAYLFGGPSAYRARRELYARVQQLLTRTGVVDKGTPGLPPLEPLYTAALGELTLRFIERPCAAIRVPQVLQDVMWRQLGAPGHVFDHDPNGIAAQKLADDLIQFLQKAAGLMWSPRVLEPIVGPSGEERQS